MTMFGKVLVFITLCFSILAVGFALWAVVDPPESFNERHKALLDEITTLKARRQIEENSLRNLVEQLTSQSRPLPYDPEENLIGAAGGPPKSVKETYKQAKDLEEENRNLYGEWNNLQASLITRINEIAALRVELQDALTEARRLREIIIPDTERNPGQKTYRDTIADTRAAREESERRVETMRPTLVNESMRLQTLMERNEELNRRAGEVEKRGGGQ